MAKIASPRRIALAPRETDVVTKCNLSSVIMLIYEDLEPSYIIWAEGTCCSGANGIFPRWFLRPSVCNGPLNCALLDSGELLYPPDITLWEPLKKHPLWSVLQLKFAVLPTDAKFDSIREYVLAQQLKWTLSDRT